MPKAAMHTCVSRSDGVHLYRDVAHNRNVHAALGTACRPLAHQMQEMQVLFVLVENIVDQLLLIPAHDIVVLAAFFQVDLRAIILVLLGLLFIVIQPGQSERRRTVAAQSDFIDKVKLIAQIDLETNAVFRSGVDAAERVLFTQLFLHQRHGRLDNLIHKALNQRAFWQIGDIAQPALPGMGLRAAVGAMVAIFWLSRLVRSRRRALSKP